MARYIDADELRSRVKEKTNPYGKPTLDYESGVKVLNMIDNAPTADVAPRTEGEWEWFEEWSPSTPEHPRECDDCGWRCGKCKNALADMVGGYWDDAFEKPTLNYCPNCGAKMRKEGGKNGETIM